jgi:heme A synthase
VAADPTTEGSDSRASLARPGLARPGLARPGLARPGLARLLLAVWRPTPRSLRVLSLAGVVATSGIIVTGAAVRLSESGLGCPDWPRCTASSLFAAHTDGQTLANTWIEFGNRLLTFAVMVVAVLVFVAAWRFRDGPDGSAGPGAGPGADPGQPGRGQGGAGRRRTDLIWLAAAQPFGVVLQAVLGGITVLTSLNPAMVSVHFLASIAIVGAAVVLYVRCAETRAPARPLVRADLRVLSGVLVAITGAMLAAGTVVTGTGPLAGNAAAPRYHLPLQGVTQVHADTGWLLGGVALALVLGLRLSGAPPRAIRLGWLLIGIIGAQGVLGYVQYFLHLPPALVGLHVLGAVLVWITALRLFFALRDRGILTTAAPVRAAVPHGAAITAEAAAETAAPTTAAPTTAAPGTAAPTAD